MIKDIRIRCSYVVLIFFIGCYGVNSQTSQIGDLNDKCLDDSAWTNLTKHLSPNGITELRFKEGLDLVKNHFIKPKYILYFDNEPKEIVGCDNYTVRVIFNPFISNQALDGLSSQLTDSEQIRIRNRIQEALMEYQCADGRMESLEWMKRPAPFSKEYYE